MLLLEDCLRDDRCPFCYAKGAHNVDLDRKRVLLLRDRSSSRDLASNQGIRWELVVLSPSMSA